MKRKLLYPFVAVTLIVSLFGVSLPVAAATITLDGQTGDWAGIPPVVEEPGDITSGPDIGVAFLTHDTVNLYARLDIGAMAPGTALHVGIDDDRNIATGYNTDTDPSNIFLQPHNTGIDYEIRIVLLQGQPPTATLYSIADPTTWNPVQIQNLNKGITAPGAQPVVAEVALPLNLIGSPFPWEFIFWVNPAAGGAPSDEAPNDTFSIYPPPRIAFVSDRNTNLEIYVMNQDGTNQTRATNNPAYDNMPFPSRKAGIVFVSGRDGNREIYVMNADGANQTQLTVTDNVGNEWPAWSPDKTRIAFSSNRDGGYGEIYTMNATDGSGLMQLTSNSTGDTFPAWSSTGKIAFSSGRDGGYGEIYVMDADGTNQTRLTNNPAPDNFPAWSPDGSKIAFSSNRTGNWEIYVMNADSTNLTQLTDNSAWDWQPQWGPDGTRIAFTSNRDNNWEIYAMSTDGTNQTNLTNNPTGDDWLRGKWIAPSVVTSDTGNITSSSVVLSGNLTDLGSIGRVKVSFQWGLTADNYTGATPVALINATGPFSANLTGLSANTTYHFRARAVGDGLNLGDDKIFTTTSAPTLGSISGYVYQSDNVNSIAGAEVVAFDYGEMSPFFPLLVPPYTAVTDGNGYYTLSLPPGDYRLSAFAEGYDRRYFPDTINPMEAQPVSVTPDQETPGINFSLGPGGTISGTVTDNATGAPLAQVSIWTQEASESPRFWGMTFTNESGNYKQIGLPYASYLVLAPALLRVGSGDDSYILEVWQEKTLAEVGAADPVVVAEGVNPTGINFTLEQGGTISGYVYQSDNTTPIAGAEVVVYDYSALPERWDFFGFAITDAQGYYQTLGLPAGEYAVRAQAPGYVGNFYDNKFGGHQADPVSVTVPNDTPNISFSLEMGGTITGQVTDNATGLPIANIGVYASDFVTNEWMAGSNTDASGNYTLVVPSGTYKVGTSAKGTGLNYVDKFYNNRDRREEADPVSVTAPDNTPNINFSLEIGGTITGQVTDNATGLPIANLHVYAVDFETREWMAGTNTDASGNYTLVVPTGSYRVGTSAKGTGLNYIDKFYANKFGQHNADPVYVTAPGNTPNINFSLELGGSISGTVLDQNTGLPLNDASSGNITLNAGWHKFVYRQQEREGGQASRAAFKAPGDADWRWFSTSRLEIRTAPDSGAPSGILLTNKKSTWDKHPQNHAEMVRLVDFDSTNESGWYGSSIVSIVNQSENIHGNDDYYTSYYEGYFYVETAGLWQFSTDSDDASEIVIDDQLVAYWYDGHGMADRWEHKMHISLHRYDTGGHVAGTAGNADGSYTFTNLPSGNYTVQATAPGYVKEWYDNVYKQDEATLVSVTAPNDTPNIDFSLEIVIPGDANMDGRVNALDITKVERIIVKLDAPTAGADANQDGNINALDITKVERIIVGLN